MSIKPTSKPSNTAEYLAALSDEQRAVVERLLATLRAAAPAAVDRFSYHMPGLALDGRPLLWVAAWKRHYSLYPVSAAQLAAVAAPNEGYDVENGTVRFPAGAAPPYDLVARLARARAGALAAGER